MKQWMTVFMVCTALLVPAAARAHDGHLHKALGTVTSIDGDHVTIKKTDGKSITIMLDKTTTVTRGKDKLNPTALKVGGRVSVDYMEEKTMLMARAIKLATAAAPASR